MNKLLLSGENDIWYFKTTSTEMMFYLLINSQKVKDVNSFDTVIDKDYNPHIILERKGKLLYYHWSGRQWEKGPHPNVTDYSKFFLTLSKELGFVLVMCKEISPGIEIRLLTLQQNTWKELVRDIIRDPIRVKAVFYDDECFLIYTKDELTKTTVGIANLSDDRWKIIYESEILNGKLLNWAVKDGLIYLLMGQVIGSDSIFHMCSGYYQKGFFSKSLLGSIDGWEGNPGIYSCENNNMKIIWSYLNNIYLGEVDTKKQEFAKIIKSDIFYPSELKVMTNSYNLGQKVMFLNIFGTKLDFPLILTWEELELMIRGKEFSQKKFNRPTRSN